VTDFRTLLAETPPTLAESGPDGLAWFDLDALVRSGADETALLAWARAQGGQERAWPEAISSDVAEWRPKLPTGRYLVIPASQI
jgi:hypothetical protein